MKLKEAQKSSTEAFKSSDNDLEIKHVNVHKSVEQNMEIFDLGNSEG